MVASFIPLILQPVEVSVETIRITEKSLMGAAGDEASVLHDVDGAGVADGRKTVGDDNGGASLHELIEGLLDLLFRLSVEGGGGLVEQEDVVAERIREQEGILTDKRGMVAA